MEQKMNAGEIIMTHKRTYHGKTPSYNVLSENGVKKIMEAVFQLMLDIGIRFDHHEKAMDVLSRSGCDISSEGIVKFPTELVKSSLDSVAKKVKIWNRPATEFIELHNEHSSFFAGAGADHVVNLKTGKTVPSTEKDLATICRVADALPEIDGICLPCKIIESSDASGEIKEFETVVANTTKPLAHFCQYKDSLEAIIDMAAAIRGGLDHLKEKPYLLYGINALPLYYPEESIDQIILSVESGLPLSVGTFAVGGASAPITHAGNLVNLMATALSGVVLSQLIKKGCFCMVESEPGFMDPSTGDIGGFAETYLAEMGNRQISEFLGIPLKTVTAGVSLSERFDEQAIMEISLSLSETIFCRAAQHYGLGSINAGRVYSLHALLFCNELVSFIRHHLKGLRIDDETLALEVTKAVGPSNGFMAEMHTAEHCRSGILNNKYFMADLRGQAEQNEKKGLPYRIDEDLKQVLKTHKPEELSAPIREKLDAILRQFKAVQA
jgi:trimethylamine--corrinoid protein Co-methyltransferase